MRKYRKTDALLLNVNLRSQMQCKSHVAMDETEDDE